MQSKIDNNRWTYWVFCHCCGKEYRDSFPPDSCDYCGSGDLTVADERGESSATLAE